MLLSLLALVMACVLLAGYRVHCLHQSAVAVCTANE